MHRHSINISKLSLVFQIHFVAIVLHDEIHNVAGITIAQACQWVIDLAYFAIERKLYTLLKRQSGEFRSTRHVLGALLASTDSNFFALTLCSCFFTLASPKRSLFGGAGFDKNGVALYSVAWRCARSRS